MKLLKLFQSGCNILCFIQSYMRVHVAPFPCQHLVLSILLIFAILGCVVISHCGFTLHFLDNKGGWVLVCVVFDHSCCFICEMSVQLFCPYFNLVGLSFYYWIVGVTVWICPLSDKCFVNICGLLIHFNGVFWWAWVFNLGKSNSPFFRHGYCFLGSV